MLPLAMLTLPLPLPMLLPLVAVVPTARSAVLLTDTNAAEALLTTRGNSKSTL
jgi:hypothetical protein